MTDVFISYSRSIEARAERIAEALTALGYDVWRDDQLPAHKAYTDVTEEHLRAAKAVVVIWTAEAVKSQWVRAEAEVARLAGTLVQLSLDGSTPPLPFNQIQCAEMGGWRGEEAAPGWKKVLASIAELVGREPGVMAKPIRQEIQYCKAADGVRIAYARVGGGPPLIKTANWLNHLEHDWDGPVWGALFHCLSANHTHSPLRQAWKWLVRPERQRPVSRCLRPRHGSSRRRRGRRAISHLPPSPRRL